MSVVLLCHFDGTNGSTSFTDVSGYGHTLTQLGSPNATVNTTAPKFGTGSGDFTGGGSAGINTGNAADFELGAGPFTLEAWAYFTSAPGGASIYAVLAKYNNANPVSWFFGMSSGSLSFVYSTNGSNNLSFGAPYTPPLNTWVHLACERDASNILRIYVNGAILTSTTLAVTIWPNSSLNCVIGNAANVSWAFPGHLDEARVTVGAAQYGGAFTPSNFPLVIVPWSFGDSFDLYATPADMVNSYWDSAGGATPTFIAGRFSGSRALNAPNGYSLVKASNVNDAVHHLVCGFEQTSAISGSTLGFYFELFDGATAQCSIVFRTDGAILLTSGGPTGTVLATYTGAFSAASTWYAFEFEVVINATTGSFTVRKNGNNVADFTATLLNTQASANAYANKLQVGSAGSGTHVVDDLWWRSGAATGSWLGDLRCYARMPANDQSVQFSKSPTTVTQTNSPASGIIAIAAGAARYAPFTAAWDGTINAATLQLSSGYTGNMKCSLFASSGTGPTTVLGSATAIINPVAGLNAFSFSTPVTVVKGTQYWLGFDSDTAAGFWFGASGAQTGVTSTTAYASFPTASPTVTTGASQPPTTVTFNSLTTNYPFVSEAQQDGLTSYVYDSNPGDQDFYGLAALGVTPASIVAVTTRGYMQKSDAGTRTATVQLKSGATTVATPTLTLTNTGFQWTWRQDLTDPNTGAAWTQAAVDALQFGPQVVA